MCVITGQSPFSDKVSNENGNLTLDKSRVWVLIWVWVIGELGFCSHMDLVDLKSGLPVSSECGLLAALWGKGFGGRVIKSNRRLDILLVTRSGVLFGTNSDLVDSVMDSLDTWRDAIRSLQCASLPGQVLGRASHEISHNRLAEGTRLILPAGQD
jgi:hypothetical protein